MESLSYYERITTRPHVSDDSWDGAYRVAHCTTDQLGIPQEHPASMDIPHSASLAAHTGPLFVIRPLSKDLIEYSDGNQDIFDAIALEDNPTMLA